MLKVENLTTSLVNNINLQINPGEIVAITGDNGSGKSTLAKVISGYYKSNSGSINLEPNQIGLLTQNPFLQFIGNTVFDELTFSLEQEGASIERIKRVLDNSPFELDKELVSLSGGQAQRLLIYKELFSSKKLLILDETLSNLDYSTKSLLVKDLCNSNKAIMLITNNINDTGLADRVYHLQKGQLQQVNHQIKQLCLVNNDAEVMHSYQGYEFKRGINLVTGDVAGGKSTLVTNFCFDTKDNISLIPQYPFEIVTTLDGSDLYQSEYANVIDIEASKFRQNITELSTGELVKLLVIEAIESGNKIIVLDEAIEVLDKESQYKVIKLLEKQFEVVIIVTHNKYLFNHFAVNIVEVLCDH